MSDWGASDCMRSVHLLLASLTLIRGRAKSSLSRWLCSESLRSLSSDMDCLGTRPLMLATEAGETEPGCMRWAEARLWDEHGE